MPGDHRLVLEDYALSKVDDGAPGHPGRGAVAAVFVTART